MEGFGPEWRQRCEDAGTEYYDMMTDAVVVHRNACITAEATVAEILKYSDYSIRGQKIIVSGYGRCGREIARVLSAMGAKVTVLARSVEHAGWHGQKDMRQWTFRTVRRKPMGHARL